MKDVIVIDTPDALLVTRVGHCQSVKKVAEYLKSGKRVEAEKHVTGTLVARPVSDKQGTALYQSPGVVITTAKITAGSSLDLGEVGHREVLVARGELILSTAQSFSLLQAGQRMDVENEVATMLYNPSQSETEVVLLTLHHDEAPVHTEAGTPQQRALYA